MFVLLFYSLFEAQVMACAEGSLGGQAVWKGWRTPPDVT